MLPRNRNQGIVPVVGPHNLIDRNVNYLRYLKESNLLHWDVDIGMYTCMLNRSNSQKLLKK